LSGSTFSVSGSHTYAEEGAYTLTITINHEASSPQSITSSATVAEVSVVGSAVNGSAVPSSPFSGAVATFTDPGGPEANDSTHYSATINWGDGSSASAGTITLNGGIFTVSGSHTYSSQGSFAVTTTINHETAAPATVSSTLTVASTSSVIENFERTPPGLSMYHFSSYQVAATTATKAAHDGTYGLDMPSSGSWIYRNDPAAHVQQGETLSVWVNLPNFTAGRAYFGFGASASGTLSLVAAADTNQLILQDNSGFGFRNLAVASQSYLPDHWYRLEVVWGVGGSITGRLYDSNGTTLLKSVQATDNAITAGGIAFLASSYDKYFDTVTATGVPGGAAASLAHGPTSAGSVDGSLGSQALPSSLVPSLQSSTAIAPAAPSGSSLMTPALAGLGMSGIDKAPDPTQTTQSSDSPDSIMGWQGQSSIDAFFAGLNGLD
ncbi:MAG TPA: hypothetical protein VKU02_06950, partial [Gemmataceae bacterium]|nr:hypothetical protein [Gemmataceae bacterium]